MNEVLEVNEEPFLYTMSLINGKWKMHILFWLSKRDIFRYGELKKLIKNITHKMLSTQLKELERDNLIIRTEYHQVPPKVEYSLSELGLSLMPVLNAIFTWRYDNLPQQK
ncbi:helix-turn-helix transcriptional regulator [Romboutsia sp. CE17]|uniref:winged helix-turn-helix transcriptional regulator n=1 Tax=Romboutsia sp. CE17 TaxID=2724150 RepID=UPI001442D3FC|nr:helix-turn-helix domain-containing protein [Romboutsia sp. CE17]QJA07689.1 helix-turn-helix transcriptional regulator [Romboutsia sp. CE17]